MGQYFMKNPLKWVPFSTKINLKNGYGFQGSSNKPLSKPNPRTPIAPGSNFHFKKYTVAWNMWKVCNTMQNQSQKWTGASVHSKSNNLLNSEVFTVVKMCHSHLVWFGLFGKCKQTWPTPTFWQGLNRLSGTRVHDEFIYTSHSIHNAKAYSRVQWNCGDCWSQE